MNVENLIYNSIIIGCLVGITLTILLFLIGSREEGFTQLFFIQGSYSNHLSKDRNISFSYGIINNEKREFTYDVEILYDNVKVESENITLKNKQEYSKNCSFILPENVDIPVKVSVNLKNLNQSIYFWIVDSE